MRLHLLLSFVTPRWVKPERSTLPSRNVMRRVTGSISLLVVDPCAGLASRADPGGEYGTEAKAGLSAQASSTLQSRYGRCRGDQGTVRRGTRRTRAIACLSPPIGCTAIASMLVPIPVGPSTAQIESHQVSLHTTLVCVRRFTRYQRLPKPCFSGGQVHGGRAPLDPFRLTVASIDSSQRPGCGRLMTSLHQ
jgi:hypothetical protein